MQRPCNCFVAAALILGGCAFSCDRQDRSAGENDASPERETVALSPETKAPAEPAPRRLLKKKQILALQKALAQEGYYKRRLNGLFNSATQRALRRFQHDHNLPVTGEPDEATLERLGLAR